MYVRGELVVVVVAILFEWWSVPTTADHCGYIPDSSLKFLIFTYACVCMYVRTYVCIYVCMYIRMYVCIYVCMYIHMYVYIELGDITISYQ